MNKLIYNCSILIIFFVVSACTTHNVDLKSIDAHKDKVFKIGVVKSYGCIPFSDNTESKKIALTKIPINDVCGTIANHYGIIIDPNSDKEIKIVKETIGSKGAMLSSKPITITISPTCNNPYYGNKEYRKLGFFEGFFAGEDYKIDDDKGEIINVIYSIDQSPNPFDQYFSFNYEIIVKSDGDVLIQHKDKISIVQIQTLEFNFSYIWEPYIFNAEKINEALKRDLSATY